MRLSAFPPQLDQESIQTLRAFVKEIKLSCSSSNTNSSYLPPRPSVIPHARVAEGWKGTAEPSQHPACRNAQVLCLEEAHFGGIRDCGLSTADVIYAALS